MCRASSAAIILVVSLLPAAAERARDRPETCLDVNAEAMRFSQINDTIDACTAIVTNDSQIIRMRADALAQRGILMRGAGPSRTIGEMLFEALRTSQRRLGLPTSHWENV